MGTDNYICNIKSLETALSLALHVSSFVHWSNGKITDGLREALENLIKNINKDIFKIIQTLLIKIYTFSMLLLNTLKYINLCIFQIIPSFYVT